MTQIDYKALIENAMLNMVRDILKKISQNGLPKNHHFLITFFSNSKGVIIPDWMKEKYPDKMTIIIRNWFENLNVTEKKFQISLNFNNTVEQLTIPFSSLELFADPSVDFAISFNQINTLSNNETKIKAERGNENAIKKKEKLNKKNENVIDLKNFKK
ncbi:MAG: ClpXP protease specificity-enhancing factor SspB [Paracoccaceae bacterium]|tara:strand:- start:86 stop:559 length:474 start_codon:yes stop_codon:yes gene_type:complete